MDRDEQSTYTRSLCSRDKSQIYVRLKERKVAIYGLVRFLQDEEIFEYHCTDLRHVTHLFERGIGGHIASEGRKERAKGKSRERPYKLVDAKGRGKSWLPVHRCVRTSRSTQTPSTRQRAFRRRRKANRMRLSCSTPTNRRCSLCFLVSVPGGRSETELLPMVRSPATYPRRRY